MKRFELKEVKEAIEHAMDGGQALHVWRPENPDSWASAPRVFRRAKVWGHLLDQNEARLIETVHELGVKVVKVMKRGTRHQHVDLCGRPLRRAMAICRDVENERIREAS